MSNVMQNRKMKGFTLIEMVIVVLLVGIMAAIAIPKFLDLTGSAKQAAYDTGLGSLKSAAAIYLGNTGGTWPTATQLLTAMEGVVTCGTGTPAEGTSLVITDIEGTYYTSIHCGSIMTNMSVLTGTQTF